MVPNRTPKWSKWRHIPDLTLWQCVALSLNIDPDKVKHHPDGWMANRHLFQESEEFNDRIDILAAQFRRSMMRTVLLDIAATEDSKVTVDSFVRLAISLEWSIPDELRALAVSVTESVESAATVESFVDRYLWTLHEAAHLLAGEVPQDVEGAVSSGPAEKIYRDLKDATDLGVLQSVRSRTRSISNRRVEPAKCVAWARARGYELPSELDVFSSSATADPDELKPKERMTALSLLLGMAASKYRYKAGEAKSGVPKMISNDLSRFGISITDETIRNWLKEAANKVPFTEASE